MRTLPMMEDAEKIQPYLGYQPLNVIWQTLANTTQLASQFVRTPLRKHVKSLYPFLNKTRLHETVATDTMFSSWRDLSGAWCAQVFYGLSSHMINIYGMKTESKGPEALDNFGHFEGIPSNIRSDNSKMQ